MILPIGVYAILIGLYIFFKPSITFDKYGYPKPFGTNNGETLFPLWIIAIFLATIIGFSYSLFSGSAEIVELRLVD